MQLVNKTTGMVEYSGTVAAFRGVDAYKHPDASFEFEVVLTPAEQSAKDAEIRKQAQLHGIEFAGVMCSATGDDQAGLSSIFMQHSLAKMAGKTFPDVHFRFENGSRLTLNGGNIDALEAAWTPFRLSFFPPGNAA